MHPEDPATGHPSIPVFLVFLCLETNCDMVPKFQVANARYPRQPADLINPNLSCCFKDR
jgi:hypothetical protein